MALTISETNRVVLIKTHRASLITKWPDWFGKTTNIHGNCHSKTCKGIIVLQYMHVHVLLQLYYYQKTIAI